MDAKTLFNKAAKQVDVCVSHVHDNQLTNKTPCTEWDLKALLNHVVYELSWVPDLLAGKTVAEVGTKYDGDLLGEDRQLTWSRALKAAQEAIERTDVDTVVHLSYGDVPAEHYIREIGSDLAIHGWDVSQSEMSNLLLGTDLAQAIYDLYLPRKDELTKSGVFAPAVETLPTDSVQVKLLALLGRKANTN